jgi:6-phospho-beta-glucosidase
VLAVKAYEHAVTQAAVLGSAILARKAMLLYPAIGEWEPSKKLLEDMIDHSPLLEYLGPGRNRIAT